MEDATRRSILHRVNTSVTPHVIDSSKSSRSLPHRLTTTQRKHIWPVASPSGALEDGNGRIEGVGEWRNGWEKGWRWAGRKWVPPAPPPPPAAYWAPLPPQSRFPSTHIGPHYPIMSPPHSPFAKTKPWGLGCAVGPNHHHPPRALPDCKGPGPRSCLTPPQ